MLPVIEEPQVQQPQIITPNISYWIDIIKAFLTIQIITGHQTWRALFDYGLPLYCANCPRKWGQILTKHILTTYSTSGVLMFFAFAGFFSIHSIEKLYAKHQNTKFVAFLKDFLFQYAKRYVQLHAVMLIFGLGYAPLLYTIFGEKGRNVYYEGPRTLRYWLDNFLPIYWRNRCVQSSLLLSGSAWFSNSLQNVEFVFYILFFCNYLVRRRFKHNFLFDGIAICVLATIFLLIYFLAFEFDRFMDSEVYYLSGILVYYVRKFLTEERYGKWVSFNIARLSQKWKAGICIVLVYCWLVMTRIEFNVAMVFLLVPVAFDLFPDYRIKVGKMFFDEMRRLGMTIYISHHPFLYEAVPRGWPELLPTDLNQINSIMTNWVIAWVLPLQHMLLAYPLWVLQRPLEYFPIYFKDFKKNLKQDRKTTLTNLCIGIALIVADIVLIAIAQADVYGHEKVSQSKAWDMTGFVPGTDKKWEEP